MQTKTIVTFICFGLLSAFLYCFVKKERKRDNFYPFVDRLLPTDPRVMEIEGRHDHDVESIEDGKQFIEPHDIALRPDFGMSPGTIGFGRFTNTFMA